MSYFAANSKTAYMLGKKGFLGINTPTCILPALYKSRWCLLLSKKGKELAPNV